MDDDQKNGKSGWVLRGLILIIFLVGPAGLLIFALYSTDLSYPYCVIREHSWLGPKTEVELDRKMVAFYETHYFAH